MVITAPYGSHKSQNGARTVIDRSKRISQGLIGAWPMTEGSMSHAAGTSAQANAVLDLSGYQNHLTAGSKSPGTNGFFGLKQPLRTTPGGSAWNFYFPGNTNALPGIGLATTPTILKPTSIVSVFWAGEIQADQSSNSFGSIIFRVSYDNGISDAPFVAYGFSRPNGSNSSVEFDCSTGGTVRTITATNVTGGAKYGNFLSLGYGIRSGLQQAYVNGRADGSTTASGNLTYASTSHLWANGDPYGFGSIGDAYTKVYALYIWNRLLLPEEFALLHSDPLAPLVRRNRPVYFLFKPSAQTISPSGKASDFAAGTPDLKYDQNLSPTGKSSDFVAGTPIINQNVINPTGKPSDFAVGTTIVSLGTITPTGKPSDFAPGTPFINLIQTVAPGGKPSDFAAGLPDLLPAKIIAPSGKASDFAAGSPTVMGGPQRVLPAGLASGFRAGSPTLSGPTPGLRIWIGGVDFTQYTMLTGVSNPDPDSQTSGQVMQLTSQTLGRWTALFDLYDTSMTAFPIIDATCMIQENGVTIFSGGISAVEVDRFTMGTPQQSYHVTAQDWSAICDRRTVSATYLAGEDVSKVFLDIWANVLQQPNEGITANSVAPTGTDTLDQNEVFNFVTVTQAFDQICTDQGWCWWIDAQANLHAVPNGSLSAAPFSLTETSGNFRALAASATLVDYRNVQYVLSNLVAVPGVAVQRSGGASPGQPGYGAPVVSETYTLPQPAAVARGFVLGGIVLDFTALEITGLKVNGVSQPVQNASATGASYNLQKSWWYFPGFPYVYPPNVNNNSPSFPYPPVTSPYPSNGDVVEVDYIPIGSSQSAVKQSGNPLTPSTPGAAGTWGSGVFENAAQVKNINLQGDLNAIAQALLTRSDFVPTQVTFETDVPGGQVGQSVSITLPLSFIPSTDEFIITSIQGNLQTGVLEFGSRFKWIVTATTGQDLGNSAKWFERLIARTEAPLPVQQQDQQTFVVAAGSSVTPSSTSSLNPVVLQTGGSILSAYAIAGTPPTNQTLLIDILDNGVSILGPGNQIAIPSGQVDPVYVSKFLQGTVSIGDVLSLALSYVGTGANPLPASSLTVNIRWSPPGLPVDQTQPGVYASYVTGTLVITTATLPSGPHGVAYTALVVATGGTPPYAFSATGLPSGLTMDASGNIVGTPTTAGTYSVVVSVTDSSSPQLGVSSGLRLVIT